MFFLTIREVINFPHAGVSLLFRLLLPELNNYPQRKSRDNLGWNSTTDEKKNPTEFDILYSTAVETDITAITLGNTAVKFTAKKYHVSSYNNTFLKQSPVKIWLLQIWL